MDRAAIEQQVNAAAGALQAGDGARARDLVRPIAENHPGHAQLWMLLAEACRLAGDMAGLEGAADHLVAHEPRAIRAWGWKGDARRAAGDARVAASWYRDGLRQAAGFQNMPDALQAEVARQRDALAELEAQFDDALRAGLHARGIDAVSSAFAESLDLLAGKAQIQLQRPSAYYFPGLPQRTFYERDEFEWAAAVEAAAPAIRDELHAALAAGDIFTPYLQPASDRPNRDFHGMAGNADWSALHLTENGQPIAELAARFPATLAAMAALPLCRISSRAPTIMFSRLAPGAQIPAHHGMINGRLICHLPLIVPGDGALRVGNQTRTWCFGELLIFDDSIEHAAWNHALNERIVLIFDVWHPALSAAECTAIAALFDVIDGA
mgnify:CR=1 FL=1